MLSMTIQSIILYLNLEYHTLVLHFYNGKYNISGKKRLASITKPAVKDNHTVQSTGAVDKYFKKLLSIVKGG